MSSLEGNISGQQALSGEASMLIGLTPNIQVGKTELLNQNENARVELDASSTKLNPVFNFYIPEGKEGKKGEAGSVKFIIVNELPTENIDESAIYMKPSNSAEEQNTYEEYIYVNGSWESLGSAKVEVNLEDYVKNTDYPADKAGVVKVNPTMYGIGAYPTTGYLYITPATEKEIDEKKHSRRAIVPEYVDYTVKSGLADSKLEWTEEEKANARNLLNILKKSTQNRCLYGNLNGVESTYIINYANEATVNSIPYRALNGAIMITDASCKDGGSGAIPDGEQAVNKNYVKTSIAEAVGNIETLLGGI
jgi:hypothetical protein